MTWQHILEIYCAVWILIIALVLSGPGIRASIAQRRARKLKRARIYEFPRNDDRSSLDQFFRIHRKG